MGDRIRSFRDLRVYQWGWGQAFLIVVIWRRRTGSRGRRTGGGGRGAEDGRQRTDDRGRRAEDGRRMADGGWRMTDGRGRRVEDGGWEDG